LVGLINTHVPSITFDAQFAIVETFEV